MSQATPPDLLGSAQLKEILNQCIHCGLCPPACPTYMVRGTEMDAPRGRIAMLRAFCAGRIGLDDLSRYVYDCIGCESCRVSCPSGVKTPELFHLAKQLVASSRYLPAPLAGLRDRVEVSHNIAGDAAENRLLWLENIGLRGGKQHAPVALFTGCVAALYPMAYGILQSLVGLLQEAQVDFMILGAGEWCCGYPLFSAGLENSELVDALMAHNIERIQETGAETLVTSCPSCYHMWKTRYPPLPFRVLHAAEFLAEMAEQGKFKLQPVRQRVTFHDPCDLGRKSKIFDAPRRLISAIPGTELVEMKSNRDNSLCCGGGGNLESVDVELAQSVSKLRMQQALEVGAEVIVSGCQQCERTLTMTARRDRIKIKVMDLTQLLSHAL